MQTKQLKNIVINALEDLKAVDIKCLDVADVSSVTDTMIVASGTSKRHVQSVAENVVTEVKHAGVLPIGTEGEDEADWVLVDLGDIVVHVMMPDTRALYDLEKLWQLRPEVGLEQSSSDRGSFDQDSLDQGANKVN